MSLWLAVSLKLICHFHVGKEVKEASSPAPVKSVGLRGGAYF